MHLLRVVPAVVLAIALGLPAGAMAHGDPASHALESESLYLSFTATPSQKVELQLRGHLDAARRAGAPVMVSLIAGEVDVPENPSLLGRPQRFAEVAQANLEDDAQQPVAQPVVIVTPSGVGVAGRAMRNGRYGPVRRSDARAFARGIVVPRANGDDLALAAMSVIRRIARASGNPLPAEVPLGRRPGAPPGLPSEDNLARDDSGVLPALAVFAAIFGGAVVSYELLTRISRRRRRLSVSS